jgi:hypothetical protein
LDAKFPADETVLKKTLVVNAEGSARGERAGDDGLTVRRHDFSRLFPEEKQIACAQPENPINEVEQDRRGYPHPARFHAQIAQVNEVCLGDPAQNWLILRNGRSQSGASKAPAKRHLNVTRQKSTTRRAGIAFPIMKTNTSIQNARLRQSAIGV